MGKMIELTASDGHKLSAYRSDPSAKPRGGIVVIQEIFGVNSHIKSVADGFAADGYLAIAPALILALGSIAVLLADVLRPAAKPGSGVVPPGAPQGWAGGWPAIPGYVALGSVLVALAVILFNRRDFR